MSKVNGNNRFRETLLEYLHNWRQPDLDNVMLSCRHVTEADLQFFQQRIEQEAVILGAGKWEHMTDISLDSLNYTAWRRRLPVRLSTFDSTHMYHAGNTRPPSLHEDA